MLEIWLGILPFLVLFLLHDAAAPLLVEKRNPFAYLAAPDGAAPAFRRLYLGEPENAREGGRFSGRTAADGTVRREAASDAL